MAQLVLDKVTPYKTIIWDWNGTLLNDARIGAEAEFTLFRRYGLPIQTYEERLKNFFMPIEAYYKKMGFDFSKVSYPEVADEWLSIYETLVKEAPLFEGVFEMLSSLKSAGKRQFVLSAAPETHLLEMLQKHSIGHIFEGIYGLPNSNADSKTARGLELAKEQNIDPKTTILVGDTSHDYEVGEAMGIDVLLVADGHHSLEVLEEVHHNVLPSRFPKS